MLVQSYLFFDGRCEEAIDFYRAALGADLQMLVRFKDNPETEKTGGIRPGTEDKVMHARLRIGETIVLVSDGRCTGQPTFQGTALAVTVATEAEAEQRFAALADGGQVSMPLAKTFFSSRFGMVSDRFGVPWMVLVEH
jgi:PhnB protein